MEMTAGRRRRREAGRTCFRAHSAWNSLDFYDGSRVMFRVGGELAESLSRGCATRGCWIEFHRMFRFSLTFISDRSLFLAAVSRVPCYASCLQTDLTAFLSCSAERTMATWYVFPARIRAFFPLSYCEPSLTLAAPRSCGNCRITFRSEGFLFTVQVLFSLAFFCAFLCFSTKGY